MPDDPEVDPELGDFIDLGISVEVVVRLALLTILLIAAVKWWLV